MGALIDRRPQSCSRTEVDEPIRLTSTSARTAQAEPIVLRAGPRSRLVFHPVLVANATDPDAAVRGVFTYQRKGDGDEWEDVHTLNLSQLRKGESVQLELRSAEVLTLHRRLAALYEIYGDAGIPFGEAQFVAIDRPYWRALAEDPALRDALFSNEEIGAIGAFAKWTAENPRQAAVALHALSAQDVASFDAAAGIARLQKFIEAWTNNRSNGDEAYWQSLLAQESWVLAQLLGSPFVIIGERAYVGGKNFENVQGRVADFLYKNRLTGNILIVEIKTPLTPLVGSAYRPPSVFAPSTELAGAVTQAIDQRQTLVGNYQSLDFGAAGATPFHPRVVVLAGDLVAQELSGPRLRSFELFRNELRGVEVVTFDELVAKAQGLLDLFRSDR
jgi:hypothetical protein